MRLLDLDKVKLIEKYKDSNIVWANLISRIPESSNSVDVIYTSHMIEHLDKEEVEIIFSEIKRVLKKGGILRISVPDIKIMVNQYLKDGDADLFIENTLLTNKRPKTIFEKIQLLLAGTRNHQWMYDEISLFKLLSKYDFSSILNVKAGETLITNYEGLNLYERESESIYIECIK